MIRMPNNRICSQLWSRPHRPTGNASGMPPERPGRQARSQDLGEGGGAAYIVATEKGGTGQRGGGSFENFFKTPYIY